MAVWVGDDVAVAVAVGVKEAAVLSVTLSKSAAKPTVGSSVPLALYTTTRSATNADCTPAGTVPAAERVCQVEVPALELFPAV